MRTIIAGSRTIADPGLLRTALARCGWTPTTVLSGDALGADRLGAAWAQEAKVPTTHYPLTRFLDHREPAAWARAGRARNLVMAYHADALIALWDGESAGTEHMIATARRLHLHWYIWNVTTHQESWSLPQLPLT